MFRLGLNMLCHMFRLELNKAVVSHVSPGAEQGCCVTCLLWHMLCHMFRLELNMLCHMFGLGLNKAVLEEACCVTCFAWG